MATFEIIISFIIGLVLILLLAWVFSLKTKGMVRLLLNALCGVAVLILLNVFNIVHLPLNPLNALLAGFMGLPGLVVIYLVSTFL